MRFDKVFGLKNGKGLFLAYDHGIEHGPVEDFIDKRSANPMLILSLVKDNDLNGVALTPGIIMKFSEEIKDMNINVIAKINSKTKMAFDQYFSPLTGSVEYLATKYENIKGIGYTIYFGSQYEQEMIETFCMIRDIASEYDLFTFLWAYPRGKNIKKENDLNLLIYSARVGMELGADAVKIKSPDRVEDINTIAEYLYKTKLFIAGGTKNEKFLEFAKKVYSTKANGMIVGRNIWQDPDEGTKLIGEIKNFF